MPKAPREPNYWWWSHLNWHHHKYVTPPVPYPENFWSRYAGLGDPKINPKTRAVLHPKVSFYQTHFFCVEFIQRWTSWTLSFESTKVCPKKNKLQTQQPQMQQLQTPTRLPAVGHSKQLRPYLYVVIRNSDWGRWTVIEILFVFSVKKK